MLMPPTDEAREHCRFGGKRNVPNIVKSYPKDFVQWLIHVVDDVLQGQHDSSLYEPLRLAVAIATAPARFACADHVRLSFFTCSGDPSNCCGYAGRESKITVAIKPTGALVAWNNEDFDTFSEPSEHDYSKGRWRYDQSGEHGEDFAYCRDNYLFECKDIVEAVAHEKRSRMFWKKDEPCNRKPT